MKKVSKKELKKYLLSKKYTYKELSNITGYHEKSLIRLNRELKNNNFKEEHGNLNKNPHNKIDDDIKNDLIKIYNDNNFKNKKTLFYF